MLPLFDLINHRQPERLDKLDHITFDFKVQERRFELEDGILSEMMLAFPALTSYQASEEFSYAYSKNIQPVQLLYSYGIYFDTNPFAIINMPQKSLFNSFTRKQRLLCLTLGCLDPRYYPNENEHEAIVMSDKE